MELTWNKGSAGISQILAKTFPKLELGVESGQFLYWLEVYVGKVDRIYLYTAEHYKNDDGSISCDDTDLVVCVQSCVINHPQYASDVTYVHSHRWKDEKEQMLKNFKISLPDVPIIEADDIDTISNINDIDIQDEIKALKQRLDKLEKYHKSTST